MNHNCESCKKRIKMTLQNQFEKPEFVDVCSNVPDPNWDEGRLTLNNGVWSMRTIYHNFYLTSISVTDCINWKGTISVKPSVRTDCYLAILEKMKKKYPNAHFEIITRANENHILSPSWKLMKQRNDITFNDYEQMFLKELENSKEAQDEIIRFAKISLKKTLFLVCYEADDLLCHRSTIAKLVREKANKIIEIQAARTVKTEVEV